MDILTTQTRIEQGLRLEWFVPSQNRTFIAYAKDGARKQAWLAKADAKGWVRQ